MCTVSFIPLEGRVIITSNRDEHILRRAAEPPALYRLANRVFLYPRDATAGGTWITVADNGRSGVLLNGAFEKHEKKESYKRSRGLVFLDIMQSGCPLQAFQNMELDRIEPFTLILWENGKLYECRWDEQEVYILLLDAYRPYFWCSSTLYSARTRTKRADNFHGWLRQHRTGSVEEVIRFHKTMLYEQEQAPEKDPSLLLRTVSITSIQLTRLKTSVIYCDQLQGKRFETEIDVKEGYGSIE